MAFIRHRGKTYSVVYKILDENGEEHTTSETFATQKEADKRKKEIEYKQSIGKFEVQKCATLKELIEEYKLKGCFYWTLERLTWFHYIRPPEI